MSSLEITVHSRAEQTILKSFSLEVTGKLGSDREASKLELQLQLQICGFKNPTWIYLPCEYLLVLSLTIISIE